MREIKFRGKRNYNGEWVYGFYVRYSESSGYMFGDYVDKGEVFDIDPETVGQLTGLHDKNGKEIYEGDILHTNEADWIAKVIWNYDGFMLTGLNNTGFSCSPDYVKCEVIGNIHENQEPIND